MPDKCSVPNCRGNYRNEECVSVFRFPRKEPLRSLWLKSIGREDFNPTIHAKVCERHFPPSDILRESNMFDEKLGEFITTKLMFPKLKVGAIPSIIPLEPCSPRYRNKRVKNVKSSEAAEDVFEESTVVFEEDFINLSELEAFMHFLDVGDFWSVVKSSKTVAFVHVNWNYAPKIDLSIVIDENLSVTVFHGNVKVKLFKNFRFPKTVKSVAEMNIILNKVKAKATFKSERASEIEMVQEMLGSLAKKIEKKRNAFLFLKEQVSLLTEKQDKTFSIDMMIFSTLFYAMAPHAYKYLTHSSYLILPDPDNISKLYLSFEVCTLLEPNIRLLQYAREGFELTSESDRCIVLQVEEIYLKPFFEGENVNIAGMSSLDDSMASSAYAFTIASLCSPFTDIVHILTAQKPNAKYLNSVLKQIILVLEEIGYSVIAVVTDNSLLNKEIMSFFSEPPVFDSIVYKHPVHSTRPLFHLIGFAHLLKAVRNDWMSKKTSDECIFYPPFNETSTICKRASFSALRKVHAIESWKVIKNGSRLTRKVLSPNFADRQDPKLVLRVFSPCVVEVLLKLGEEKELPHYQETAGFIKLFCTWWSVVNPRSLLKATHINAKHELPLSTSDENYDFLKKFLDWLDGWSNMKLESGMLRAETFSILRLSTYALLELTAYCKNELGINFIFPGNFLTESQIIRFGFFKRHPGIHKFVHLRQLDKEEQLLKCSVFCGLSLMEKNDVNLTGLHLKDSINLMDENLSLNTYVPLIITDEDFTSTQVNVSALIYLGACCIRSVLKNLPCSDCEIFILTRREVSLHASYDSVVNSTEENIRHPPRNIIHIVHCIFIVLQKLFQECKDLIKYDQPNKALAYNLTMNVIENLDFSLGYQECDAGHSSEKVLKMIVKAVVYTILNNYAKNSFQIVAPPVKKSRIDILLNNPKYDIKHLLSDRI